MRICVDTLLNFMPHASPSCSHGLIFDKVSRSQTFLLKDRKKKANMT